MSELGHQRRFARTKAVSGPPLTTDMPGANAMGSSGPKAEIAGVAGHEGGRPLRRPLAFAFKGRE